jgi:hypothetical protein
MLILAPLAETPMDGFCGPSPAKLVKDEELLLSLI